MTRFLTRTAAVLAGAALALTGTGIAQAAPVTKTLTYTCEFPLIGPDQMQVTISVNLPDSAVVGQPAQATNFTVSVLVPEHIVEAFDLFEAKSLDGSAVANFSVKDAAGVSKQVNIPGMVVPSTPIPDTGDLTVPASGNVPPTTIDNAGNAEAIVGDNFEATLTPRKADGSPTELGTFTLPCGVNAGQDQKLGNIPVAAARR
ncbi:hypothetical protein JOF53_006659 [Crossiella equi]|uniref:DUF6801 domain-containing protein n=1 Tax=Crossiella equi TaxID=130796 RepID=A0ABS5AMI7_9PSEU|nr:DUF6801 domain-containing protein [Crossiella equi]MBP2477787.1 hypothetical protein [Crossiella equi]